MLMKIKILILLTILGFACPLKSDTLYLKNGEQISGQLLRITPAGLIFEVRSGLFTKPEICGSSIMLL